MRTIADYLETEFSTFEEKPFNRIDSLILSQFSMVRMDGIVDEPPDRNDLQSKIERIRCKIPKRIALKAPIRFRDALLAEHFDTMFTGLRPEKVKQLSFYLAANPRFRNIELRYARSIFDESTSTQFAAICFVYKDLFSYVGYRGTDSSFTGWREDFNMAYMPNVPAQIEAVSYLEDVLPLLAGNVYLGGHSKGGNLAAYALAKCSQEAYGRITQVFSHDGPGFKSGTFSEQERIRLRKKVDKTVPQDSIIGMLFENETEYDIVESNAKGIDQHDAFTWHIDEDNFVLRDSLSSGAAAFDKIFDSWLESYNEEEIHIIVDMIFECMEMTGAENFLELTKMSPKTISYLRKVISRADEHTKRVLIDALSKLGGTAVRSIFDRS